MRGESTRQLSAFFVLRCSATDEIPNTRDAPTAAATAMPVDTNSPVASP